MANFYVDLSQDPGTPGAGTIGNPYNAATFLAKNDYTSNDTFYLKGTYSSAGAISKVSYSGKLFNILPWDLDEYGPWSLNGTNVTLNPTPDPY